MYGIPDNQSSQNIFDAFLHTTKPQPARHVPRLASSFIHSPRKVALLSAASLVVFGAPIAIAASNASDSYNKPPSRNAAAMDSNGETATQSNNIELRHESSSTGNTSSHNSSLTINGQPIPIPGNGSIHQTITDGSSQTTTVDVESHSQQQSSSGSVSNNSSSSVNVQTNNESRGSSP